MDGGGYTQEELEYLKNFQKVYVEELGQEVFMDPAGNLYDMDGNHLGQADQGEDIDEQHIPHNDVGRPKEPMNDQEMEFMNNLQRVYVEDLGQEVLMDPAGNLYDMNGNLIGQADPDGGEDEDDLQMPPMQERDKKMR